MWLSPTDRQLCWKSNLNYLELLCVTLRDGPAVEWQKCLLRPAVSLLGWNWASATLYWLCAFSSLQICPICAALPGGDPNHVTDDFAAHLTLEHRAPRDLISFQEGLLVVLVLWLLLRIVLSERKKLISKLFLCVWPFHTVPCFRV